ncbi:acyltransferase [Hymenobacter sp. BT186]|uniref:Acyltransferase n=1 Tax=Hymenobacter telluris TaxID=2816474 RepID=A0A939ETQ2_9BACT|nr:acyltransferase [Hymenobacter telluris]MBO0357614.1 acyltransferase [Hymenobacter telluris]MBW3373640.1 acyltransferase [Hymenobacter norwichensis]
MLSQQSSLLASIPEKRKVFDFNLEALRGVAALLVVWHHIVYATNILDPAFTPTGIWAFDPPAHLCVLVFFVLSGYVIGISHTAPLTKDTILGYLKKRAVRLYPIYAISIALTVLLAVNYYSVKTIVGHFIMTHVLLVPVMMENAPAWSLHYEVLYYILFISVSYFRLNPLLLAISSFVIGFSNAYLYPRVGGVPLLSAYAFGFTFWLTGLTLAKYMKRPAGSTSWSLMLSLLLLLFSLEKFNIFSTILSKASIKLFGSELFFKSPVPWYQAAVAFQDFAFLPFCIIVMAVFASKDFRYLKYVTAVVILVPMLTFYSFYKHYTTQNNAALVIPCICYILSVLVYLFREKLDNFSGKIINRLIVTGGISYGLYIIHFPVFYFFNQIQEFSGSLLTFVIRLFLYLLIVVGLAYLLEKKLQPWIKRMV